MEFEEFLRRASEVMRLATIVPQSRYAIVGPTVGDLLRDVNRKAARTARRTLAREGTRGRRGARRVGPVVWESITIDGA